MCIVCVRSYRLWQHSTGEYLSTQHELKALMNNSVAHCVRIYIYISRSVEIMSLTLNSSGVRTPMPYPPYLTAVLMVTDLPLLPPDLLAFFNDDVPKLVVAEARSSLVFTPPDPSPLPIL